MDLKIPDNASVVGLKAAYNKLVDSIQKIGINVGIKNPTFKQTNGISTPVPWSLSSDLTVSPSTKGLILTTHIPYGVFISQDITPQLKPNTEYTCYLKISTPIALRLSISGTNIVNLDDLTQIDKVYVDITSDTSEYWLHFKTPDIDSLPTITVALENLDDSNNGAGTDILENVQVETISIFEGLFDFNSRTSIFTAFEDLIKVEDGKVLITYDGINYSEILTIDGDGENLTALVNAIVADILSTALAPESLLSTLKNIDGSGSGLDADLLDGADGSEYLKKSEISNSVSSTALDSVILKDVSVSGDTYKLYIDNGELKIKKL